MLAAYAWIEDGLDGRLEIIMNENHDLLRRSLFSWTLEFGLVRLYQHEFGL